MLRAGAHRLDVAFWAYMNVLSARTRGVQAGLYRAAGEAVVEPTKTLLQRGGNRSTRRAATALERDEQ